MAIYHLTAKTGSRSGGQSARAKADYIQREGKYARDMDEVLHAESGHMPEFVERTVSKVMGLPSVQLARAELARAPAPRQRGMDRGGPDFSM